MTWKPFTALSLMLKDIKHFVQLSRPVNIVISAISFAVACYIANDEQLHFVYDPAFWATILTIITIAATGYWINDVYDFRIDRVNKPRNTIVNALLSVKKVLSAYFIFNVLILAFSAIILGGYFEHIAITFVNFMSILLLFVYASYLKRVSVAGNLVISFLIALVVILAGYLYEINLSLIWMIIFSFEITLIREITKDVEDIRGDLQYSLQTLPIQIGIRNTKNILLALYGIFFLSCYLPFVMHGYRHGIWLWPYLIASMILVQAPSIYIVIRLIKSYRPSDFTFQSRMLKLIMLTGIITLFYLS